MPFDSESKLILPQLENCKHFIPLPLCFQENIYSCGVACVQSLLASYGIIYRQDILSILLKQKPIHGTDCHNISSFLSSLGFAVEIKNDMEIDHLTKLMNIGITPLLLIQAWKDDDIDYAYCWRDSHYVIACGYDDYNIIFMDPYTIGHYTYIPKEELIHRWHHIDINGMAHHHCGLVVTNENLKRSYRPDILKPLR